MKNDLEKTIESLQGQLESHRLYENIINQESLRTFMEHHVFAVWDFMTLLKALQIRTTCVTLPWRPSRFPKRAVRIINELVLGEESDVDYLGLPKDHFTIYCNAMVEVGADPNKIMNFMTSLDFSLLKKSQKDFVKYNLDLAINGSIQEIAGSFFFGREKVIPGMFKNLLLGLDQPNDQFKFLKKKFPNFVYYFERHIEVDSGEHKYLSEEFVDLICVDDDMKALAYSAGIKSLQLRNNLWNDALSEINNPQSV